MTGLLECFLVWAQSPTPGSTMPSIPAMPAMPALPYSGQTLAILQWLRLFGDPMITTSGNIGGLLTWLKTVALLSLVCWIGSWLVTAFKERTIGQGKWFDYLFLAAFVLTPIAV